MTVDEALDVVPQGIIYADIYAEAAETLAAEVQRLRGEVEKESKAACHWTEEANRDYNEIVHSQAGWTSVEERLPFDDAPSDWRGCLCDDFLVAVGHDDTEDGVTVAVYEYNPAGWHYLGGEPTTYADEVTHWMPLPEPPHG
jgi:hypothetical protein